MKEFSFNSSIDDENENGYNQDPNEKGKIFKFIIIVVVSLVAGLSVYFVTDALINGNKKPTTTQVAKDQVMDLDDEMITYLYDNVTYAVNGIRSDKFFKSGNVSASDFTTQEKIYFALRYATESDFIDMSSDEEDETSESGLVVYGISNDKIKESIFNFFGEDVTYTTNTPVNIAVNFIKNGYNAGTLEYDATSDYWLVTFDSVSESGADMVVNPYLYKIESAMREGKTSNIIIKERVVFTAIKQNTDDAGQPLDSYDYAVYQDYAKTKQLEMQTGVVADQLTLIGIDNYEENAATITYTFFKDENDEYHFLSSEIVSE